MVNQATADFSAFLLLDPSGSGDMGNHEGDMKALRREIEGVPDLSVSQGHQGDSGVGRE